MRDCYLLRIPAVSDSFSAYAKKFQPAADGALPGIVAEHGVDFALQNPISRKPAHIAPSTIWTVRCSALSTDTKLCTAQHQRPFRRPANRVLDWAFARTVRMSENSAATSLLIRSHPCKRASPTRARSATARARVGDAFNDSGRSRRMPNLAAYSLNAMSTS